MALTSGESSKALVIQLTMMASTSLMTPRSLPYASELFTQSPPLPSLKVAPSAMYSSGNAQTSAQMSALDAFALRACATGAHFARGAVIAPPPPYSIASSTNVALLPPPPYSATCHASASNIDVDVVGITDEARDVRLSDDEDDESKDEPLDLSVKKKESAASSSSRSPSAQPRPSVIRNGYAGRHSDMRRSASSVTSRPVSEPDVSEHFRRSLSGKWPRRQTNHSHYIPPQSDKDKLLNGVASTHTSCCTSSLNARRSPPSGASPPQQIIVNNSGIEIEDHFRKALGAEAYELLRKSRQTNLV
ncbi:Uncharacterized protein R08C7.12 [Toxocara canis]|uniref:Uncharacterized protein R08C7.12 n=1 Tax=Toxocara canis TaxID=6265 RepID=A0A0B2UKJ6_TOXCA|nr:Uncharacterized protein R08C7.12 [Toxocara canis]